MAYKKPTKSNKKCAEFIASFEGCVLNAYWDKTGKVWTIGYGHTAGVRKGQKITKSQALKFLQSDLKTAEKYVNKYVDKYHLNQRQYNALVSFTFNCGGGNLNLLTNYGSRSKEEVGEKILRYTKSGGVELKGLVRRRKAEHILFKEGRYTDGY